MHQQPLRWAVIGTGKISSQFARALAKVPGHARYALVSRDPVRAASFAQAHGFTHTLALNDATFQNPDIDVFYIGTPTDTHRDLCLRAIQAGKPFLCEKPMTHSAQDFEAVRAALQAHPVFAMEAMWLKFNPLIRSISDQVRQGALGQLVSASMQIGYQDRTPRDALEPAADALAVFGCYAAALAIDFFGYPKRVLASGRPSPRVDGFAHATVMLDYADFTFSFECSVVAELANALSVHGEAQRICIPLSVIDPYRIETKSAASMGRVSKMLARLMPLRNAFSDILAFAHPLRGAGFRGEIAEVGAQLRQHQNQSPRHPLQSTAQAHQIIEAARASACSGQWQVLK
jgi:predicted dehydrogenase